MKHLLKIVMILALALPMFGQSVEKPAPKPAVIEAVAHNSVLKDGLLVDQGSSSLLTPVGTKCTPGCNGAPIPVCEPGSFAMCDQAGCVWRCYNECGPQGCH